MLLALYHIIEYEMLKLQSFLANLNYISEMMFALQIFYTENRTIFLKFKFLSWCAATAVAHIGLS